MYINGTGAIRLLDLSDYLASNCVLNNRSSLYIDGDVTIDGTPVERTGYCNGINDYKELYVSGRTIIGGVDRSHYNENLYAGKSAYGIVLVNGSTTEITGGVFEEIDKNNPAK